MLPNKNPANAHGQMFLGYEFLTWFFLLLDREEAGVDVQKILASKAKYANCQVVLGSKLVTCLLNHREQKTSVASPLLEDSHEIFASLRNGHVVESLAISIKFDEISVGLLIHADDFALTQVKISSNFENQSFAQEENTLSEAELVREEIFLRMAAVDDVGEIIDILYHHFLNIRLVPKNFANDVHFMRNQIEKRLSNYLQARPPMSDGIQEIQKNS